MSLNPIGVPDLSIVTELLIDTVDNYWPSAAVWSTLFSDAYFKATVSGLTPEVVRKDSGCQVTVSLIHIEPNKSQRNFVYPPPPAPQFPRAQQIPALPLGLDLFYFVTAYSADNNYQQEQQAMSIILNCFHQNPILRKTVTFAGSPPEMTQEEFTLTMEIESVDSISRLWQAITSPFRLSLLYRVAVVFLTPPAPPPPAPPVVKYGLALGTTSFPFSPGGQVFGTSSSITFVTPESTPANPESVQVDYSPATVTAGQRFFMFGAGLNQGNDYTGPAPNPGTSYRVFLLLPPDYASEVEVTAWKPADIDPTNPIQTADKILLDLPSTVGALPANAPQPGVYALRAGSDPPNDAITNRTNTTPFSIAARVDVPGSPLGPILPEAGGQYTITGMGFIAGDTEILLDTIPLTSVASLPISAGQFFVTSATAVVFTPPSGLNSGIYTVRIRVNSVESPPALWIKV